MKTMHKVHLIKATIEAYPIIQNMARFYGYDMSRSCGYINDWDWSFPENGLYEGCNVKPYFEDQDRYAFIIKVDNELAGFALINKCATKPDTDWNMGEFFIVAKFQGKGIGEQAAHQVWQQFPGIWEIAVIPENTPALNFWRKCVSSFTLGTYVVVFQSIYPEKHQPNRYILTFESI